MTGPDGRFEFQNLTGGGAWIQAQKPGYFASQDVQGSPAQQLLQIGHDSGIKLNLYPSGSISGKITTIGGDPIEGVLVKSIYRHVVDGMVRWDLRNSATTDDAGVYRIANLVPGTYLVATDTHPARLLSPHVRRFGESFDDVYPGVYFAGSPDASAATPIQVMPGQIAEANISESVARAYSVSGSVAGDTLGELFISLLDHDGNPTGIRIQHKANHFRCFDVLPGDYTISVAAPGISTRMMYGQAPLSVKNTDVDDVSLDLFPSATIPVRVQYPDASNPAEPPGEITLEPAGQALRSDVARYRAFAFTPSTIVFENIRPGNYRLEFQPSGPWYATGIRSGQADLTRSTITVTPGMQPDAIEIVLGHGGAAVSGTVKGAEGLARVNILAVPDADSSRSVRLASSRPQFSLSGLAPGAYRLYAFASIEGLEYRNPEVMKKYDDQSVAVDLSNNETRQIDLRLIHGSTL